MITDFYLWSDKHYWLAFFLHCWALYLCYNLIDDVIKMIVVLIRGYDPKEYLLIDDDTDDEDGTGA